MKVQLWKAIVHDRQTSPHRSIDFEMTGSEEKIDRLMKEKYPEVYFEEQEDGAIVIWRSQVEADQGGASIGEVVKDQVIDLDV